MIIEPHGGTLVDRIVKAEDRAGLIAKHEGAREITESDRTLSDIYMLTIGGFIQGLQWMDFDIAFLDTVKAMAPYYLVRLFSGVLMLAAQLVFAFNVIKTVRGGAGELKPAVA